MFSKLELVNAYNRGEKLKFVLFWGHTPKTNNIVDKSCFSQWYEAKFEIDNQTYPTAEHFMMAEKARLFNDENIRNEVFRARTAGEAKALGRNVSGFNETMWQQHRLNIVVAANFAKFSQNQELGMFLVNTKQRILVEASPHDRIWGIGLDATDERAANPNFWRGDNLLGFALMKVRQQLRETDSFTER